MKFANMVVSSYIHGIMDGELITDYEQGFNESQEFVIK
jgi:hypothetical protein